MTSRVGDETPFRPVGICFIIFSYRTQYVTFPGRIKSSHKLITEAAAVANDSVRAENGCVLG